MTDYLDAIQACNACALACENCARACLAEEHADSMRDCIRLDLDCAALCRLSALLMIRDSRWATEAVRICARACRACAQECARHPHDHCQQCSQTCSHCAVSCEALVA